MSKDNPPFNSGLNGLSWDDQQAFLWLGILHEDAVIRPATAATLWAQPEAEALQRLQRLQGALLIQPVDGEGYRLDSAMREEARHLLSQRMPLAEAHIRLLEAYHAQTRDNLWHTLPDDGYIHDHLTWHMEQAGWEGKIHPLLKEETAEGRNAWHEIRLRQGQPGGYQRDVARARKLADEGEDLGLQCRYALIAASTSSVRNEKLPALLDRLVETGLWSPEQALAYACELPDASKRAQALARLAPLLPEQFYPDALAAAREIEDGESRARALVDLAAHLPASAAPSLYNEILAAVQELRNLKDQAAVMSSAEADVLSSLVPHVALEERADLLAEILDRAREIEYPPARFSVLVTLIPCLEGRTSTWVLKEALAWAHEEGPSYGAVTKLLALVPYLSESQRGRLLADVLIAPRGFEFREMADPEEDEDTEMVTSLDSFLPRRRPRGINYAGEAMDYAGLVARLAADLSPLHLWRALSAAQRARDAGDRAEALAALAPHLREGLRRNAQRDALAAASEVRYHPDRARVLAAIAASLPEAQQGPVLEDALDAARQIGDDATELSASRQAEQKVDKIGLLAWLGTRFPEPRRTQVLDEALALALDTERADHRTSALKAVARHLPEPLAGQVFEEALLAVRQIGYESSRQVHLWVWASFGGLPESLWPQILDMARELEDNGDRARVLVELPRRLPETYRAQVLDEALDAIWDVESEQMRVYALRALASQMPKPMLERVLHGRWTIGDGDVRARTLAGLAGHLPVSRREAMLSEALTAGKIRDPNERAYALVDLIPILPAALLEPALDEARNIEYGWARARTLLALAPRLPEEQRAEVLEEIRSVAAGHSIPGSDQIRVLLDAAALLPDPERKEVLSEALAMAGGLLGWLGKGLDLTVITPYLPDLVHAKWQEDALTWAREQTYDPDRALTGLVPHLPDSERSAAIEEALAMARKTERPKWRADALLRVAACLTGPQRDKVTNEAIAAAQELELGDWDRADLLVKAGATQEALVAARALDEPSSRACFLTKLLPDLPGEQRSRAVEEALAAIQQDDDWDDQVRELLPLAPYLAESLRARVVVEVMAEGWRWGDYEAQAQLAARLAELPPSYLPATWSELLPRMEAGTRDELLSAIRALAPLIASLGGPEAVVEVFHAVQDVGRWWP